MSVLKGPILKGSVLTDQREEPAQANQSFSESGLPTKTYSTWQDMAGHWLKRAGAEEREREAQASRLAAIQRWRGLEAESAS